jgi:hypothetical protein
VIALRLSLLPASPSRDQVCLHPSCFPRQHGSSVQSRKPPARWSTAMRATYVALLQGPSLRSRLCCPGPSSLNRPHPPLSRAHRNFAAQRFICGAFAVRERLSNPREVPGFRCTFLPGMPSPETPRSSTSSVPDSDADIGLRQAWTGSALPISLQSVSRGVNVFGASTVRTFVTACQFARPPCTDPTGFPAVGDFYYQASNGSVALPVAGYNYNSDWTPLLVGFAPTGMAASLAAPKLSFILGTQPITPSRAGGLKGNRQRRL